MAIRWIEGFETRQNATFLGRLYDEVEGQQISSVTTGRRHGGAYQTTNSYLTTPALVSAVENVWVIHFAFRKTTGGTFVGFPSVALRDGTGEQIALRFVSPAAPNADKFQVQVLRGATVLATSPIYDYGNTARAWHVFQWKVTVDPVAGAYELRHYDYNGTETTAIAAATGANTANQGVAGADRARFTTNTNNGVTCAFDDIVVLDGTGSINNDFFAGPVVVCGELPNGDGDLTQFSPSSGGSNFALVQDAPTSSGDTGEVTSSDVGTIDLYDYSEADLSLLPTSTPPSVHGVMVDVEAQMKNSGTANIRVEVKDGMDQATDTKDLDFTGNARESRFTILEQNPTGTPAAWTVASLTDIQIGINYAS